MIENDCARCHTTWGPARRFAALNGGASSIANDKCLACHPGLGEPHQPRLASAELSAAETSCAECHREHRHHAMLAEVADSFCTSCHADLAAPGHGGSEHFVKHISTFEAGGESGSHPEFAIQKLLKQTQVSTSAQSSPVDAVEWFLRKDDFGTKLGVERYQDRARIRFNHKQHFGPVDEDDRPRRGVRDGKGVWQDLSQNCQTCHHLDSGGRYMLPIRYETHCRECHPLRYDDQAFPDETVPHAEPRVVRGFLIEQFSGQALNQALRRAAKADKPDGLLDLPYAPRLPMEVVEQVEREVDQIERGMPLPFSAGNAEHRLFGPEARGGCRYCHDVVDPPAGELWKIVTPNIPERWMKHSRFRHRSHEFMKCRECHTRVDASFSTGDVLLPEIALCRTCHAQEPILKKRTVPLGNIDLSHENRSLERDSPLLQQTARAGFQGARTHCVECHVYHHAPAHGKQK